jgi:hypothetical protein
VYCNPFAIGIRLNTFPVNQRTSALFLMVTNARTEMFNAAATLKPFRAAVEKVMK